MKVILDVDIVNFGDWLNYDYDYDNGYDYDYYNYSDYVYDYN